MTELDSARAVVKAWKDAGAPAPSDESRANALARVAGLDGPDAERVARRVLDGVPSLVAYLNTWTARAKLDAKAKANNDATNAKIAARNARKRELSEEMRAIRDSLGMTQFDMAVATGVKLGTLAVAERPLNWLSMDNVEAITAKYRDQATLRSAKAEGAKS